MVTSPITLRVMHGQLRYLKQSGFDVVAISSPGEQLERFGGEEGVETRAVRVEREISPWRDFASLLRLLWTLRRCAPDITNVSTPKASLLGSIAAALLRVPCRIYTLRGLKCETSTGLKQKLLLLSERVTCALSHRVICAGPSLRQRAIELGVVSPEKAIILARGSTNGVNRVEFEPTPERREAAQKMRGELGISAPGLVIGFVARFTRDKGIPELYAAFVELKKRFPDLWLLLVGDFETGDPVDAMLRKTMEEDSHVVRTGFVKDPAPYFHLMDVLALPTHREGFPNVALEAQAAAVPVVTTRATGAIDSVLDGETGFSVPVGQVGPLTEALRRLLENHELRKTMGSAGQEWVSANFSSDIVWTALSREYRSLLLSRTGLAVPERSWRES